MGLASLAYGGNDLSGRLDQIFRRAKLAYHVFLHNSFQWYVPYKGGGAGEP